MFLIATAPPANYNRTNHPYAGAYDRNAYEMRQKVWQSGQSEESRISPPPEYPGNQLANHLNESSPAVHSENIILNDLSQQLLNTYEWKLSNIIKTAIINSGRSVLWF